MCVAGYGRGGFVVGVGGGVFSSTVERGLEMFAQSATLVHDVLSFAP